MVFHAFSPSGSQRVEALWQAAHGQPLKARYPPRARRLSAIRMIFGYAALQEQGNANGGRKIFNDLKMKAYCGYRNRLELE